MATKKNASLSPSPVLAGQQLVAAVVSALEEKLAEKITVIDLREISSVADWFVICQGDNTAHTTAIADGVIGILKEKHGARPWHFEGLEAGRWALIDYTDVVVHVMLPEAREFYDLESLWEKKNVNHAAAEAAAVAGI